MIVNLDLHGKKIVVIGGGRQAQKRLMRLVGEGGDITVISPDVTPQITRWVESKSIKIKKQKIKDSMKMISDIDPDIIITTTNDLMTNQNIINYAKKAKIMVYSSDNPDESDFANLSIINLSGVVQVAIFTGGKSPSMSKKIAMRLDKLIQQEIKQEDIEHIRLQNIMRNKIIDVISDPNKRKQILVDIMEDESVDRLIKDGQIKRAEERAIMMMMENIK